MRPRPSAAALLLLAAATAATRANFALFPGPGLADDGSGYAYSFYENTPLGDGPPGTAVAVFDKLGPNGANLGDRAVRWGPNLLAELPTPPTPAGGAVWRVRAANAAGDLVGSARYVPFDYRAARWSAAGVALDLPGLGVDVNGRGASEAIAVNAAGVAAGWSRQYTSAGADRGTRALRWSAAGVAEPLGLLAGPANAARNSSAADLNDAGVAVGVSDVYVGSAVVESRAVRWAAGSSAPVELPAPSVPGYALGPLGTSTAERVTNSGYAVGLTRWSTFPDAGTPSLYDGANATRWNPDGSATLLASVGVSPENSYGRTSASAVNEAGVVVGTSFAFGATGLVLSGRAVRWDVSPTGNVQQPVALDPIPGAASAQLGVPLAVNASNVAVGYSEGQVYSGNYAYLATLWRADGTALDLSALVGPADGWRNLSQATSVSDAGWVTGIGTTDPDGLGPAEFGPERPFLLLVPEAGTYGRGDADFDGDVDFADLATVAANYGAASNGSADAGDFDLDGDTDFADLATLAANYGGPADASALGEPFASAFARARASVPEPAALALVAPALLGLRRGGFSRRPRTAPCSDGG